jgi:hypothetical protein
MVRYAYIHPRGDSFHATEEAAFAARERNGGRGYIYRVEADNTFTCIG